MIKKWILTALCAAMLIGTPVTAFADESDTDGTYTSVVSSGEETDNAELAASVAAVANSIVQNVVVVPNDDNNESSSVSFSLNSSAVVSDTDNTDITDSSSDTDNTENTEDTDVVTIPDYYGDSDYDTAGNASLIREQKIIYDSSEMQFIAVTTKSGHIFYILIDYTAVKDAENGVDGADARETVYFLNKVDDYDLYSLIYDDSDIPDYDTDYYVTNMTSSPVIGSETDTAETSEKSSNSSNVLLIVFLLVGAGVVVAYYFLKIKPKKNAVPDEEDDDDFEYEDEPEINEDEELESNDGIE